MLREIVTKVCAMLGRAISGSARDRASVPGVATALPPAVDPVPTRELFALPTTLVLPTEAVPTNVVGTRVGIVFVPTSADRVPTLSVVGSHADPPRKPACRQPLAPAAAASAFLDWLRTHGLDNRPWPVDDVWYLASEDFAPATDVTLPPRNPFLGALQRLREDVRVQYDKRIRIGGRKVKTTVYTFAPVGQSTPNAHSSSLRAVRDQEGFTRAA